MLKSLKGYVELTKPRIVSLLVFTALVAMIAGYAFNGLAYSPIAIAIAGVAITAGSSGCNAVTCYIDRDIDALMSRTRHRVLPSRKLDPPEKALLFGIGLIAISLILAAQFNFLAFAWMALGAVDNVIIYSLILKRRNPLNIIIGGVSGGLPVMFGWAAATGQVALLPITLAALVVLWIPIHIWHLAIAVRQDYRQAGVPMLPVVIGVKSALRCIMATSIILFPFSLAVLFLGGYGIIYGIIAVVFGAGVLAGNLYVFIKPTENNAWKMFKVTSPYLTFLFLGVLLDSVF